MRFALPGRCLLPVVLAIGPAWAAAPPPTALPAVVAESPRTLQLDVVRSQIGFEVRTRFGQRIEGVFPRFEGRIEVLSDGRHQVHLKMFTRTVEIPGKERYTGWMRGRSSSTPAVTPSSSSTRCRTGRRRSPTVAASMGG